MSKTEDFYCIKYVVPYRQFPDRKMEIINELKNDNNVLEILTLLLNSRGWRERSFASIAIGILKLENFIDQIFQQALPLDEYYSSESYAFALTVIETTKTEQYLEKLSKKEVFDSYSKNVQQNYLAGLSIRTKLELTEEKEIQAKKNLQSNIDFWALNSINSK